MRDKRLLGQAGPVLVAILIATGFAPVALATTSKSDNYQMVETQFGATSNQESCSGEYCARASIGDMSAGGSSSGSYTASFDPIAADSEPLLEVIVSPGESNLGVLTTEKTASKTTIVKVRNYLSDGYTLQMIGDPPQYEGHSLHAPSSPTASTPGREQFAINLADNTTPQVGASPVQVPSEQTSFGVVMEDYRTPNLFMYSSGDVIARSDSQSGQTDYTISMIVNVSNSTPAGHFVGDFSAVVIPVY